MLDIKRLRIVGDTDRVTVEVDGDCLVVRVGKADERKADEIGGIYKRLERLEATAAKEG